MRHPVILSSLEEDFKNLGLVDDKPQKPEALVADAEDDDLEEGRRRVSGSSRSKRTKKMSVSAKIANKKSKRKNRSKQKAKDKRRMKSAGYKKLQKFNKRFETNLRTTLRGSGLFEEVDTILASLDEDRVETAIKSFANIAIISEMLSEFFDAVLEEDIDDEELAEELSEAADFFDDLSESAAGIASALNEGDELDVTLDEIEEAFAEQMESLVEGLEFYADLTEDDDFDEDDDLDEEDLEEMEDDDADDQMPDFIKKKMKAKMGKK